MKMRKFFVVFLDKGNCEIYPEPMKFEVQDLAEALEEGALSAPEDAVGCRVYEEESK